MLRYEFVCTDCGHVASFPTRSPAPGHYADRPGHPGKRDYCQGRWKRRYSANVVWPAHERGH